MWLLLRRLVAPDVTASLKQVQAERDFYYDELLDARNEIKALKYQEDVNRKVYEVTVQHLISQICQLTGGKAVPSVPVKRGAGSDVEDEKPRELTSEEEILLRDRAREACQQKILDREVTEADIDIEYDRMMADPFYYLSN